MNDAFENPPAQTMDELIRLADKDWLWKFLLFITTGKKTSRLT
jgi:hypothetical protein